ncbi:YciE/YciF ferroxidase family protein [Hymenobacter crusticola]|uniref:Uncharacterized protein n=1 Tax=Hymenobacter crusticola TaxID=1770526 RepID=A0A2C9ZTY9_9BACT|nr:DUF892 family protein [Hymenobacter crusticola]OUJ70166.1 hypothetical protein BXP70_25285 [Hymenobacter crusticola]
MNTEDLKELVKNGLAAQQAGSQVAAAATDEIQNDAKHPELKAALEQGNATSKEWAKRIERAIAEIGEVEKQNNEILEAHYRVSKEIRGEAKTDDVRDLGIITSGQLALHYWIASFGTMASYAGAAGYEQIAQEMKTSVDEAKQADDKHTEIAKQILSAK